MTCSYVRPDREHTKAPLMPPFTPKPAALRTAIAESFRANVKSYRVEEMCDAMGITRIAAEESDPFSSKSAFVENRLLRRDVPALVLIAQRVLREWDDSDLESMIGGLSGRGVDGEMVNLIFAADGPKPDIVLDDALNNRIRITRNAQNCLVYDRPLAPQGLSWAALVDWWVTKIAPPGKEPDRLAASRALYTRLAKSLDSEPEQQLFRAYCAEYAKAPDLDYPALIPQVYLHYDPYSHLGRPTLLRQRMDFLLLLPSKVRVVIEIDGKHHYAEGDRADPRRYAQMVSEDRRLRLTGYEVYRFGGQEFVRNTGAWILAFFDELLAIHLGDRHIRRPS